LMWVELYLGQIQHTGPQDFLCFKMGIWCFYLPLGWGGWTMAKCVLLMQDPTNSKGSIFCYNQVGALRLWCR
jgi:hypothetical protein